MLIAIENYTHTRKKGSDEKNVKTNNWLWHSLTGTGKSTWIKSHTTLDDYVVSRDVIRFQLLDEAGLTDPKDYFAREDEVWALYVAQIENGLRRGYTVWADATHLSRKGRLKLLYALSVKPDEVEVIDFWCPLEVALERNNQRQGTRAFVPKGQIRRMFEQREATEFGECEKYDYNKIYVVDTNSGAIEIREEIFK